MKLIGKGLYSGSSVGPLMVSIFMALVLRDAPKCVSFNLTSQIGVPSLINP